MKKVVESESNFWYNVVIRINNNVTYYRIMTYDWLSSNERAIFGL